MEAPPRQTSKIALPEECTMRKGVNGRPLTAFADVDDSRYMELRCASSIVQLSKVGNVFRFQSHSLNGRVDWTSPTNVLCFHCCHSFHGPPIPVPHMYDLYEKLFFVKGNFCSLGCAKTYLSEREFDSPNGLALFLKMANEVYGVSNVHAAPPREALKAFGGSMALAEFRGVSERRTKIVQLSNPPFVNSYTVCEEQILQKKTQTVYQTLPSGSVIGLRRPQRGISLIRGEPVPGKSKYELFLERRNGAPGGGSV